MIKNIKLNRKKVSFVYEKPDGEIGWRTVKLIKENNKFIKCIDSAKHFKQFSKKNIIGSIFRLD